ncbi:hypothetical protein FACS1894211_13790 [Clostridia bacterium]|nr:hypothetical protein FACS1894211_13790 [Clostridia bacterium]
MKRSVKNGFRKSPLAWMLCILMSALAFVGCTPSAGGGKEPDGTGNPPAPPLTDLIEVASDFSYFGDLKMNADKHLKAFGNAGNYYENVLMTAIQGLFAQTESVYYYNYAACSQFWLDDMVENYGFTYETVNTATMVNEYIEMCGGKKNTGYILYDFRNNPDSLNYATSLAGIKGWLPLDKTIADKYTPLLMSSNNMDVSDLSYEDVFEDYKSDFNNTGLFQLDPALEMSRDYWIANKYFGYYGKYKGNTLNQLLATKVQEWVVPDAPVFGWGADIEHDAVTFNSQFAHFTVGSDSSYNLTVYACRNVFGADVSKLVQSGDDYKITAQTGKHYVCIVMSDGDNLQASSNTFATGESYYKAVRGDFPMGWTMSPSAADVQPGLLRQMYANTGEKDYFVASVSGTGYMYPDIYLEESLIAHCSRLNVYLERADLKTLQIMVDRTDVQTVKDSVKYYAQMSNLDGGMLVSFGLYYIGFYGSVYWVNDKPFVGIRETLWNKTGSMIAESINGYKKDPTSIEGYSLVNVHPWSTSYADVVKLVENLDDDCVVVNANQFFNLISENVPHNDVTLTA